MDAAENGWTGSGRNRRKSNGEERGKLLNGLEEAKHRKQKGMALWKAGIGLMFMLLIVLALFVMMVGMDNAIQTGTTMLKKVAQKGEQMSSKQTEGI
jgi:Na+-transporting methylmalonyl-CoA/oxaloacetate decarboxylase gamma subunit